MEIRLFAIYTLRQVAEEYPDSRRAIIELLTAYVRALPQPASENAEPPADVVEILRMIRDQ